MKKNIGWIITVVVLSLMLVFSMVFSAAGVLNSSASATSAPLNTIAPVVAATEPATAQPTLTPDPCSSENIAGEVARVNSLTREFMDTDQVLASTLLRDTSIPLVQELQRIRRAAEDQVVPSCLADLKKYQVVYMNARIDFFGTALAFLNQYGPSGEHQSALNQVLEPFDAKSAIVAHQYEDEYARLMGLPTLTPSVVITVTATP